MAKKPKLFGDRPQEIEGLTFIIQKDITGLTQQIARLQQFHETKKKDVGGNGGGYKQDFAGQYV